MYDSSYYGSEVLPNQDYILAYEREAKTFKEKAMAKPVEVLERYQRMIEPKTFLENFCQIFNPTWMMKQSETDNIIREKRNLESKLQK